MSAGRLLLDGARRIKGVARLTDTVKLRRSLLAPVPAAAASPSARSFGCAVRLGEDGVEALEAALPYKSGAPLAGRLALGDSCYAAVRRGGEGQTSPFGAMMWVATNRPIYVYELDGWVTIPEGVAWVYEAFTFPEARNRGLARTLLNTILRDLAARRGPSGAPRALEAWISRSNAASLKVFRGQGFEPYGTWKLAALGPARLTLGDVTLGAADAVPAQRSGSSGWEAGRAAVGGGSGPDVRPARGCRGEG